MSLSGLILLDKPSGITSNKALQIVKHLYKAKKAGHTGSLDPLATGMLPICFGEATKFSQFMLDADKHYFATAKLGVKTDTSDSEGNIIETKPVKDISPEKIENILKKFRGVILQKPSMFSALKYKGKPLYELARKGIEVERKKREITIYKLNLIDLKDETFSIDVHSSKGTYIRNLVEDIGDALGCGAHVTALRRYQSGHFMQDQMTPLSVLEDMKEGDGALEELLLPIDSLVQGIPTLALTSDESRAICHGQSIFRKNLPDSQVIRLYSAENNFLGVANIHDNSRIAPKRLVSL